jgi:DNA-binding LacI/PurR family transcriptional regulator
MSLQRVAQLAGVSTSTVCRVVHEHPSVAGETASAVRAAMQRLSFTPSIRRPRKSYLPIKHNGHSGDGHVAAALGFLVLGTSGANAAPAFEKLLRGVSAACNDDGLSLKIGFVSSAAHLPQWLLNREIGGLLLHGDQPADLAGDRLRSLPTVWLMANRRRPSWGDQVMPNNAVIGDLAAKYLIRRGHRRLAHLGVGGGAWSLRLRSFAFQHAAEDAGATARVLDGPPGQSTIAAMGMTAAGTDYWNSDGLAAAADAMVGELLAGGSLLATGLFVAEDRLLPLVDHALRARGIRSGAGGDVEIISCNNEQPHHIGLQSQPAVIDIHPEAIGRRGVEQLIWRTRNRDVRERVRTMVDPTLVEPADTTETTSPASHAGASSTDEFSRVTSDVM